LNAPQYSLSRNVKRPRSTEQTNQGAGKRTGVVPLGNNGTGVCNADEIHAVLSSGEKDVDAAESFEKADFLSLLLRTRVMVMIFLSSL